MSDSAPPAAGWYADPENPAGERWWNGSGWSDHRRDSTVAAPVVTPAPPVVAPVAPVPDAPGAPTGFEYGAAAGGRPDPYAPPAQPAYAAPTAYTSPYTPAPYGSPAYGGGTNGLAVAGLIVSAAGWLVLPLIAGIAGIILSAFGLSHARRREAAGNPNTGRGIATAGLVIGIVVTAIGLIIAIFYVGMIISFANYQPGYGY